MRTLAEECPDSLSDSSALEKALDVTLPPWPQPATRMWSVPPWWTSYGLTVTSLGPLVAAASGAESATAAQAAAVTARAREARIVEPPAEDAPKRCSGKFDEYAFHDEPSPRDRNGAFRHWSTPVRRHAVE